MAKKNTVLFCSVTMTNAAETNEQKQEACYIDIYVYSKNDADVRVC